MSGKMLEVRSLEGLAEGRELAARASSHSVVSDVTSAEAIDMIVALESERDRVKKQRDAIIKPIKAALDELKAQADGPIQMLDGAAKMLRDKVKEWQQEQERVAAAARAELERKRLEAEAEQARERQRIEDEQAEREREHARKVAAALESGAPAPAPPPAAQPIPLAPPPMVVHVPEVQRSMSSTSGTATVKKRWTYEVINASLVPREFCDPVPGKLRSAVNAGRRSIPGVRIFEDTDLSIKR